METRANHLLVGSFVLVLFLGCLAFVVWLTKLQVDTGVDRYVMIFTGSVTGLAEGSPVRFSGVRVGQVTQVRLDQENPEHVIVTVELTQGTPVKADTVASLELEGLAGGRYLLLRGGTRDGAPPRRVAGFDDPVIDTRPSALEQVLEGAPDVLDQVNGLLLRGSQLLSDENIETAGRALANLEHLSGALAGQTDNIDALIGEGTKVLANLNRFTGTFADRSQEIDGLILSAAEALENLNQATATVSATAQTLQSDSGKLAESADETLLAVRDVAGTATVALRRLSNDMNALTSDGQQAAQSFSKLAATMNAVVAENREPLRDFTSGGLYELANVLAEMRQLIVRLNRVTTQVERDPARFLFGDPQEGYEANDR